MVIRDMGKGVYFIVGRATKDATLKRVGGKNYELCEFSLAVDKAEDTRTVFANCKAWHDLASYAALIKKGASVAAVCRIEEREHNGKTYRDYVCDWIDSPSVYSQRASPSMAEALGAAGFSEDDSPFI